MDWGLIFLQPSDFSLQPEHQPSAFSLPYQNKEWQ
jgi:hypothetical protein